MLTRSCNILRFYGRTFHYSDPPTKQLLQLILKAPSTKIAEFANTIDPGEKAHNEMPHMHFILSNQRTNGPVNAHLISWPSKAQNIQNLDNIW